MSIHRRRSIAANAGESMSRRPKPKDVREAAELLGTVSWLSRVEKMSPEELRSQQSQSGKLGGRPRTISEPREST